MVTFEHRKIKQDNSSLVMSSLIVQGDDELMYIGIGMLDISMMMIMMHY